MAHEILSIKLCELEKQLDRLDSRIRLSETAGRRQLQAEIGAPRRECEENELILRKRLQHSRAGMVSALADAYARIEQIVRQTDSALQEPKRADPEDGAEGKILLAEYALDFAAQAANRALLLSMEAVEAQAAQQEEERSSI